MESRRGRRDNTDVAVRFVALPGTIGTGRVTNISLSGAFMETTCKLALGTMIYIEGLERGKTDAAKRLAATVIRRCTAGVGLEWCAQQSHAPLESRLDTAAIAAPAADDDAAPFLYHLEFID